METNKISGAEAVIRCLLEEGVDLFMVTLAMPVYDELYKFKLHHVLVRHEQGATHAAQGYARALKSWCCIATSGPEHNLNRNC
jgi:acetolactate synthase-1/2/3 large subunit